MSAGSFPVRGRWFAGASYLAILVGTIPFVQSTTGWLILGLAPVLWLDRHVFHLAGWSTPIGLWSALLIRLGFFLVGAGFLYSIGAGMITLRVAAYIGVVLSLGLFLLEVAFDLAIRLLDRWAGSDATSPSFRWRNIAVMLVLFVPLFFVSPLGVFHPISLAPNMTPADLGLVHEDVRLQTEDGLELPGWLVPHPQPRGSVIFCHGHGGNRQQCFMHLKALHELGLNVLAFDFRGSGESPGHTATFGLREVPDVLAAEAFLVRQFPEQPIFVLGISYGAGVTMQALPRLQHARAAWIECCFSRLSDIAQHRFRTLGDGLRTPLIFTYSVLIWLDTGCWPMNANPIDHLDRINIPLCFCHGKKDDLIPFNQAESLFAAYRGPKRCYWLDDGTHGNLPAEGGEEYFARFRTFFEEQLMAARERSANR